MARSKKITRARSILNPTPESLFSDNFLLAPPALVYHYTTQLSFASIIESNTFWATDIRYLNDFEEYTYAVARAKSAIESAAKNTKIPGAKELAKFITATLSGNRSTRYSVFSLSEDGDSLNQWRSYTRLGPGYALGFSSSSISKLCLERGLLFGKCIYSKETAEEMISDLAKSYMANLSQYFPLFSRGEINEDLIMNRSNRFVSLFLKYASFIKNPAFEQEREWRIVASSDMTDLYVPRFRSGPHSMVPFTPIEWSRQPFLSAIKEIVVKPTPHMDLAEQSIYQYIQHQHNSAAMPEYEIKDLLVRRSAVPYREGS
jgi:hypothetical protein